MSEPGEYKIIRVETNGEVHIKENSQYNRINADWVIVYDGVRARLFGSTQNLTVEKNAKVFVHGCVTGIIKNEGGRIYIYTGGMKYNTSVFSHTLISGRKCV